MVSEHGIIKSFIRNNERAITNNDRMSLFMSILCDLNLITRKLGLIYKTPLRAHFPFFGVIIIIHNDC